MSDRDDDELCFKLSTEISIVMNGHKKENIMTAISLFLAYLIHDDEPKNGAMALVLLCQHSVSLAYSQEDRPEFMQ